MQGMDILGIAQQGMAQAQTQVEKTANRIAGINAPSSSTDSVSLSDDMVALLSAKNQFAANVAVAHTADEMQKKTLDLLA
jgi:flagellar basal body rod protein FlgC